MTASRNGFRCVIRSYHRCRLRSSGCSMSNAYHRWTVAAAGISPIEKRSPARKVRSARRSLRIRAAANDRFFPFEIISASRLAGGVLMSSMNRGRKTGQNVVACQSIQRSASKRVPMYAGDSRPFPFLCARYRTITFDSHSLTCPSSIVGTRPFGLSARYSVVLFTSNSLPASILSYSKPSSPQHQRTFWTLMELARPQIFNISINPNVDPLAWYDERSTPPSTSGRKFVREHCWLTDLWRHGQQFCRIRQQCCRHRAIEMRGSSSLIVECVEDCESCFVEAYGEPSNRAGFGHDKIPSTREKI